MRHIERERERDNQEISLVGNGKREEGDGRKEQAGRTSLRHRRRKGECSGHDDGEERAEIHGER